MDVAAACSGFVYAFATAQAYIHERAREARPGDRRGAADPLPRLHGPQHVHPVRRRGGRGRAVGQSTSRAARLGIEMTTEPQGAYMIWLPAGGAKSPPSARDDRPRRALHPDGGQGDLPLRDEDDGDDRARVGPPVGPGARRHRPVHPAPGEHPDHRGRGEGPRPADGARCSSTSTSTATPRPRRCRSPSPRRSTRAGSRSATTSSSSPSGRASRAAR